MKQIVLTLDSQQNTRIIKASEIASSQTVFVEDVGGLLGIVHRNDSLEWFVSRGIEQSKFHRFQSLDECVQYYEEQSSYTFFIIGKEHRHVVISQAAQLTKTINIDDVPHHCTIYVKNAKSEFIGILQSINWSGPWRVIDTYGTLSTTLHLSRVDLMRTFEASHNFTFHIE